jgi:hypothetical protein
MALIQTDTTVLDDNDNPVLANKRDAIMIRLLDECLRTLSAQGCQKLFIDAVKGGEEGFQSLGENYCLPHTQALCS